MPLYDYSCRTCGYTEEVACKMAERPKQYPCPVLECEGEMKQDITIGVIQCDDAVNVPWIREFAHAHNRFHGAKGKFRARDGGPPIQSRTDYQRYLERTNLRPDAESVSTSHD